MNREDALRKIKACWALSESANEEEAARALFQAIALMKKFDLDNEDVLAADVNELSAKAGGAKKPPEWEAVLAAACARAFGCKTVYSVSFFNPAQWQFIGVEPATTQAQYAFTVLFRRAGKARAEYVKKKLSRCKPANKTARGNSFAEGWVQKVVSAVYQMPKTGRHDDAIEAYLKKAKPRLGALETRPAAPQGRTAVNDRHAGNQAAQGVEWTRGIGGTQQKRLGHG